MFHNISFKGWSCDHIKCFLFPNRVESTTAGKFRGFSQPKKIPEQFQTNIDVHPFAVLLPSIIIWYHYIEIGFSRWYITLFYLRLPAVT